MPLLKWDETEVLACLEVDPEIDEDGISHSYHVCRGTIHLHLTIFQYDSSVHVTVKSEDQDNPIIDFKLMSCAGIQYHKEAYSEYLLFAPSDVVGEYYKNDYVVESGFKISVNPSIAVSIF